MKHQKIEIRSCEPEDFRAIHNIHIQPKVQWGTLCTSGQGLKLRVAEQPDSLHWLVASVDGEIIGSLGLSVFTARPRRRHVGELGMAVHAGRLGRSCKQGDTSTCPLTSTVARISG